MDTHNSLLLQRVSCQKADAKAKKSNDTSQSTCPKWLILILKWGGKELGDELYIAFCMWDPSFLIVHN